MPGKVITSKSDKNKDSPQPKTFELMKLVLLLDWQMVVLLAAAWVVLLVALSVALSVIV